MKKTFIFILLGFLATLGCGMRAANDIRHKYNFNSDWKLHVGDLPEATRPDFADADWKTVTLPHAFNEDEAFCKHIEQLTDTVVWYRKHFRLPDTDKGKKIFIEFEGARMGAEVYVNGRKVGMHENGVMAFGFDISIYLKADVDNVIAVRTDNSWNYHEKATGSTFQWNNKNFNANYGGLPKNVYLHVAAPVYQTLPLYSNLHTKGTYIYATDMDIDGHRARIHAESEVHNASIAPQQITFAVRITDPNGREVARFSSEPVTVAAGDTTTLSAASMVDGLHFWSWGYGYLYDVTTTLLLNEQEMDVVTTRTGFRKTEFNHGFITLNNRPIQAKGYAQRTSNEWPGVGMSVAPWLSDYSNGLMVEGNANMVRWMHVTPWKQDVESCDRVGLMQMFPAGDAESDVEGRRWEQRKELMRDAIIYNRNNPSVILLECGNESISETHMAEMKAIRDRYDPHGGRAIGSREMLDSKVAEYGGEMLYINKSAGKPMIATEYCRDEALRKYWDELTPPYHKDGAGPLYRNAPALEYNRNQDSFAKEEVIRWYDYFSQRPGTGTRVSGGGLNIVFSDTNTHCRGEENYRRSGETDAVRICKDAFFAHQTMWNGWVDVEKQQTYIIGHWNYAPETVKDLMVVSPADKVELFVNGQSLGFGERSYHFLHTFKQLPYRAGELKAVSYRTAPDGKLIEVSRDIRQTTGKAVALKLTQIPHPGALRADGADMVLIQVEAVDAQGRRVPDIHPAVTFRTEGPADWRGGIGQGTGNYVLSKTLPAECGVNRALIRTTTQAGRITVTASSDGLQPAVLSFESVAFPTENGLTTVLPSDGLKGQLGRGETPQTPSFVVSRRSIAVVSATAGANADKAALSYDDNELSEWTNDGKAETAWITYKLREKTTPSEVCLKLAGWRSKRYTLEIRVGKTVVWAGTTPQSLGYVTLPLKPVKGNEITIRLTGNATEKDAFENMVELNGKKELDGFKDKKADSKGLLRIIEAEFYSKP